MSTTAGDFTLAVPTIESFSPTSAGLDEVVTIKGSGFGSFIKTTEATQPGLGEGAFKRNQIELGENVSRTEVLFNNIGAIVHVLDGYRDQGARAASSSLRHRQAGTVQCRPFDRASDHPARVLGSASRWHLLHAKKMADAGSRNVHDRSQGHA